MYYDALIIIVKLHINKMIDSLVGCLYTCSLHTHIAQVSHALIHMRFNWAIDNFVE